MSKLAPDQRRFATGPRRDGLRFRGTLIFAPGRATLQLVFGDKDHKPHVPAVVSKKVTITVK